MRMISSLAATSSVFVALTCAHIPRNMSGSAIAAALAFEFETVAYTRADLLANDKAWFEMASSRALIALPFDYLRNAMDQLRTNALPSILAHANAVFAAAEDFRPPHGLGLAPATRCYVIQMQSSVDAISLLGAPGATSEGGVETWRWTAHMSEFGEKDARASDLVLVKTVSHILVCNNDAKLGKTMGRLSDGALASSFEHLQKVVEHDVWVYRRYRLPADFPMAAGVADVRTDAQAIALYTDRHSPAAIVSLFSSRDTADPPYKTRAADALPVWVKMNARTWQLSIALDSSAKSHEAMFGVMGMLGFVVYL